MSTAVQPLLDHIVILVSHNTLLGLSDHIQDHFILAQGGNHADGLTTNKLILFADGVYIELIAFFPDADPEKRRNHRWGSLPEGTIIDWALTLPPDGDFSTIQQRFQENETRLSYTNPVPGGRIKEDGTELEWAISQAIEGDGNPIPPGRLPFWCLDRTPRHLRVPYEAETQLTQHPSQVSGISALSVQVPHEDIPKLKEAYDALFGGDSTAQNGGGWPFGVPSSSTAGRQLISLSGSGERGIRLVLHGVNDGRVELLPGLEVEVEQ